jgi:hypothetical protein
VGAVSSGCDIEWVQYRCHPLRVVLCSGAGAPPLLGLCPCLYAVHCKHNGVVLVGEAPG